MIAEIKLIEYNTWANKLIAELVATLPVEIFEKEVGGGFPSIRKTMQHMLEADWIWMNRLNGQPLADIPADWSTETGTAMAHYWSIVHSQIETLVKKLAATTDSKIKFVTKKGIAHNLPFGEIVIQVVNHASYHRGQIANMIRMQGIEPVHTDYFIFCTL